MSQPGRRQPWHGDADRDQLIQELEGTELALAAAHRRIGELEAALREFVNAFESKPTAQLMWWDRLKTIRDEARAALTPAERTGEK